LGLRSGLPQVLVVSVLVVSVPEELVLVVSVLVVSGEPRSCRSKRM